MTYIGIMLFMIGATMGVSENLLIPMIIITAGATLALIGQRRMLNESF